jgi:hypothetical protein
MSAIGKRSVGMRVLKFLLGTDQPSFVAAAAGVSIAWGNLVAFWIVYSGTGPRLPLWQTIGFGLVLGHILMPFFFMAISRASRFMSPWEALAMLTATILYPLALRPMGELGVHPILILGGCFAFIGAAFFTARVIVKRHRSSLK